jgi:hypothetical protein
MKEARKVRKEVRNGQTKTKEVGNERVNSEREE